MLCNSRYYYYILFVGCFRWGEIHYVLCECWCNVRTVHVVSFSFFALAHFKQPLLACPTVCRQGGRRVGPAPLSARQGGPQGCAKTTSVVLCNLLLSCIFCAWNDW